MASTSPDDGRTLTSSWKAAGPVAIVTAALTLAIGVGGGAYGFLVLFQAPARFVAGLPWLAVAAVTVVAGGILLWRVHPLPRGNQKVHDEAALDRQFTFIVLGYLCLYLAALSILAITVPLAALLALAVPVVWLAIWLPEGSRTTTSGFQFAVNCSPEKAFDFVANRANEPLYEIEVETSELLTGLPIGVGSRFFQRVRLPGILMEADEVITQFERPHRLGLKMTTRVKSGGTFTFSPLPGGGTVIRWDAYRVDGLERSWAGMMLHPARRSAHERIARHRQVWSARLKELLETQPESS